MLRIIDGENKVFKSVMVEAAEHSPQLRFIHLLPGKERFGKSFGQLMDEIFYIAQNVFCAREASFFEVSDGSAFIVSPFISATSYAFLAGKLKREINDVIVEAKIYSIENDQKTILHYLNSLDLSSAARLQKIDTILKNRLANNRLDFSSIIDLINLQRFPISKSIRDIKRVLIVDDDATTRQLLSNVLRPEMELVMAASSNDALKAILEMHPDIILLDIDLPDVNGFSLMRILKTIGVSTPIVMLSGRKQPENVVTASHLGAKGYIVKPFSKKMILDQLQKVFPTA